MPTGYRRACTKRYELVAHRSVRDGLREVLTENETLYDWAAQVPQPLALRGRAPVYVATLPYGDAIVAVRHVWHGGFFAPLTADRFRTPTRAPIELANSLRLRAAGIGTTEILGYVLYPAGVGLRRIDVASRFIPDSADLGAVISRQSPTFTTHQCLPAVYALLRQLAVNRVVHSDLNVKNILLVRTGPREVDARVIDVDVIRFESASDARSVMEQNVTRLVRSIRKWRLRFGADLNDDEIAEFERLATAQLTQ